MNNKLLQLCKDNKLKEIYEVIASKTTRPSLEYKDLNLTIQDFDYLKKYTINVTRETLCAYKPIPNEIMKVSNILGHEHIDDIKQLISNFVISQESAELSLFLSQNFYNLDSLKDCFLYLETIILGLYDKYGNIPDEWNIQHSILIKSITMIKQRICDYFFATEADDESYTKGFSHALSFEKGLQPYFATKTCCGYEGSSNKKGKMVECIHTRMLSSVFIPHISKYFSYYLRPFTTDRFNQSKCELNIIDHFLLYFREVSQICEKVEYLDDSSTYFEFIRHVDSTLLVTLKRISTSTKFEVGVIVMNTLVYISDTFRDLVQMVRCKVDLSSDFKSLDEISSIDKHQTNKLEKILYCKFDKNKIVSNGYEVVKGTIEELFSLITKESLYGETKFALCDLIFSIYFQKLTSIKMTQKLAIKMLGEVCELKSYLAEVEFPTAPLRIIETYIKIFIHPSDDHESFISNFEIVGGKYFSFHQVLKALKDAKRAEELFLLYKKTRKNCP